MMPPNHPAARIGAQARRGKNILPAPLYPRLWVLPRQRAREQHFPPTAGEISIVQPPHHREVIPQRLDQNRREHRPPVLRSLAIANREDPSRKIEILHTQTKCLQQPKSGTVQERRDEFPRPLEPSQDLEGTRK